MDKIEINSGLSPNVTLMLLLMLLINANDTNDENDIERKAAWNLTIYG